MSLFMSDDPARDAERYIAALDLLLEKRPKCHNCDKHIQDDEALHYTTAEFDIWLCPHCVEEHTEYIEVD